MSTEWMTRAACINTDPEAFFPAKHESGNTAKKVCAACPVIEECLQYAVDNYLVGIFGGTNEKQRRAHRKGSKSLVACPTCGEKFANKGAVATHVSHRHANRAGVKGPTRCPDCGLSFKSRQGMSNHRSYKHKEVAA